MAEVVSVVRQISDGSFQSGDGQTLDEGCVPRLDLPHLEACAFSAGTSAPGKRDLHLLGPEVSNFVELCCGFPGDDGTRSLVAEALVGQPTGLGGKPDGTQVFMLVCRGSGVPVNAVRHPDQVAGLSEPGQVHIGQPCSSSLSRGDKAPLGLCNLC